MIIIDFCLFNRHSRIFSFNTEKPFEIYVESNIDAVVNLAIEKSIETGIKDIGVIANNKQFEEEIIKTLKLKSNKLNIKAIGGV